MHAKPEEDLTELQYWWVFAVSLLGPLAAIGIETAWIFQHGRSDYQALIFHFNGPLLWLVVAFEFFFTLSSLILLKRWLGACAARWAVALTFCALWTAVAFLIMPAPTK